MYGLDGTRRLTEFELPWLSGYEGSAPVRVGNAAAEQLQLDVWGEVLDGLYLARQGGLSSNDDAWDLQVALLDYLEGAWQQPDNGLWEMRGPRRHFVHSKVMAWVAFDRMVRSHREFRLAGDVDLWEARRDAIHAEVCAEGFDADRNTFVQAYGSKELDASLLLIPRLGFLPGSDPRVAGTVEAISRELTDDGFVLRYRTGPADDGLPGGEGVFLACSFWLVDALHATGREQRRRPVQRGVGSEGRTPTGQHPAGVQPLPGHRERHATACPPASPQRPAGAQGSAGAGRSTRGRRPASAVAYRAQRHGPRRDPPAIADAPSAASRCSRRCRTRPRARAGTR